MGDGDGGAADLPYGVVSGTYLVPGAPSPSVPPIHYYSPVWSVPAASFCFNACCGLLETAC